MPASMVLSLLLAAPPGPQSTAPPAPVQEVSQLANRVRVLVASSDPVHQRQVLALVDRGLPPGALVSFLVATARHPDPVYAPALRRLLRYRRVEVRGRAVVALVALGGAHARNALLYALDDLDPRLRELGVALAQTHTDPRVEEALLTLRTREPERFSAGGAVEPVMVVEVDTVDPEPPGPAEPESDGADLVLEEAL